jgi:hypothetical protein
VVWCWGSYDEESEGVAKGKWSEARMLFALMLKFSKKDRKGHSSLKFKKENHDVVKTRRKRSRYEEAHLYDGYARARTYTRDRG